MEKWNSVVLAQLVAVVLFFASFTNADHTSNEAGGARRKLLGFKEKTNGSNLTFDCSLSGACVPCLYSEKSDEKYRCSETGYRIPFKCVEIKGGMKDGSEKKSQNGRSVVEIFDENAANLNVRLHDTVPNNHRSLLDDSTTSEDGSQAYITYRSCIPPVNEEKLSVLGFEGIILCLFLVSGSFVYFRRKQTATMSGVGGGRIQMNSRF